jgi:hypothetical protein
MPVVQTPSEIFRRKTMVESLKQRRFVLQSIGTAIVTLLFSYYR